LFFLSFKCKILFNKSVRYIIKCNKETLIVVSLITGKCVNIVKNVK